MDDKNQQGQFDSKQGISSQPSSMPPMMTPSPQSFSSTLPTETTSPEPVDMPTNIVEVVPPALPPQPENITPLTEELKQETTTTTTTTQPSFTSPVFPLPPVQQNVSSFTSMVPETKTVVQETKVEETFKPKKKNKTLPIILGVLAIMLVAGVAGASYFISNRLAKQTAVAPNAPTSKPLAGNLTGTCTAGCGSCSGYSACGTGYECCYIVTNSSGDYCKCVRQTSTGTTTRPKDGTANNCDYIHNTGGTGPVASSCENNPSKGNDYNNCGGTSCGQFTYKCGQYCYADSCGAAACGPQCQTEKRDTPSSNTITFSKTGVVIPYMRNTANYTGTITLSKAGSPDIIIQMKNGNAVELTRFNVNAGDVYTIKSRISTESRDAYGWRPNKSDNVCGPSNAGCGGDADISAVRTLAFANSDVSGITSGGSVANIQCWGDATTGDVTQDFDFNDFTFIFGYAKVATPHTWTINAVPVCPTGTTLKDNLQMFRIRWPQEGWTPTTPVDCVTDAPAASNHTMTFTNSTPQNGSQSIYVGLETGVNTDGTCTKDGVAFPISSVEPAQPGIISTGTYFNPPTQMSQWSWSALASGTYTFKFNVPASYCTTACTPVAGVWSDWGACSATTCGTTGTQTKTCTNPAPSCGGATCTGSATQACSAASCPLQCAAVKIAVSGQTNWTTIPVTDMPSKVKVGSTIRIYTTLTSGTAAAVQFRVTIDGVAGAWQDAAGSDLTVDGGTTKYYYLPVTINASGAYTFESQVK